MQKIMKKKENSLYRECVLVNYSEQKIAINSVLEGKIFKMLY